MHILVLNVGSSSLKFQLVDTDEAAIGAGTDRRLARGQIERIGGEAIATLAADGGTPVKTTAPIRDHAAAVEYVLAWIASDVSGVPVSSVSEIQAVGHRVVHGGEKFARSTLI